MIFILIKDVKPDQKIVAYCFVHEITNRVSTSKARGLHEIRAS